MDGRAPLNEVLSSPALPRWIHLTQRSRLHAGVFFFSSRRRHTRCSRDWSSDVCSSDLRHGPMVDLGAAEHGYGAIMRALYHRAVTGTGARLDVSMLRSAVSWMVSPRSEERRVGKEGRSRWSPYH